MAQITYDAALDEELMHAHNVADITATGTPSATTYLRGDGTWATIASGSGDVVGPSSATDNALVRFDLTTGKLIQDSTYSTLDDNGQMTLVAGTASSVPLTLKGAASQSGNLLTLQNSSASTLSAFNKDGRLQYNSPTARSAYLNLKAINESASEYYLYAERYQGAEWFYVDTQANMRLWGTLLVSARSNTIGTRALYAEKYGASGNVTAVEFGCIAPSSMSGTHTGVYFNSDVRPGSSNFSGSLYGAKYYLYFSNNNGTTSTGSLYGSYYTFDDQSTYGTLANLNLAYFDGMRLIRSTGVITNYNAINIKGDGTSHAGTITNQIGINIGDITLGTTTKLAIKTGKGGVQFGDLLSMVQTTTLTGAVTDGYSASIRLTPTYTAATAQTVTRHNYLDINTPTLSGAGPAAVTDAAVMRFDAAAGTHKAVDSSSTKTTPGTVDAWVKININGTVYYMPAYTSKTS